MDDPRGNYDFICALFDTLDRLVITSDSPSDDIYTDEFPLYEYWEKNS